MFAQDEATSAHFGMPGAASGTSLVHAVLPLPGIASAILGHVRPADAADPAFSPPGGGYPE